MNQAAALQNTTDIRKRDFALDDIALGTVFLISAIFVNRFGIIGNITFFLLLAVMAVGPVRMAFQAFTIGIVALCANQAIVLKTIVWAYARFAILIGLSSRFAFLDQAKLRYSLVTEGRYITLCLFCAVAAVTSLLAGNRPEVALLKVVLFWLSLSGLWSAVNSLRASRIDLATWMVKIVATVCSLNILSLVLGIGNNFRDARFTHGLYNLGFYHSQTAGPACGLMTIYLLCVWLFTPYRNRWICAPLIAVLLYSIYLSGSRTGVLVLGVGLATIMFLALAWRGRRWFHIRMNISRIRLIGTSVICVLLAVAGDAAIGGKLSGRAAQFLVKKQKYVEEVTIKGLTSSRQALIDRSMKHFRESPWIGNGFQMYGDREVTRNITIMTSQVEKGFLPAALLEEVGVVGAAFFVLFIFQCFRYYARDRNIPGIAAFAALLAMNLGECSFFSFAGQGGFYWMFVAAADLLGASTKIVNPTFQPAAPVRNRPPLLPRAAAF